MVGNGRRGVTAGSPQRTPLEGMRRAYPAAMHASAWSPGRLARPSIVILLVIAAFAGGMMQSRARAA